MGELGSKYLAVENREITMQVILISDRKATILVCNKNHMVLAEKQVKLSFLDFAKKISINDKIEFALLDEAQRFSELKKSSEKLDETLQELEDFSLVRLEMNSKMKVNSRKYRVSKKKGKSKFISIGKFFSDVILDITFEPWGLFILVIPLIIFGVIWAVLPHIFATIIDYLVETLDHVG